MNQDIESSSSDDDSLLRPRGYSAEDFPPRWIEGIPPPPPPIESTPLLQRSSQRSLQGKPPAFPSPRIYSSDSSMLHPLLGRGAEETLVPIDRDTDELPRRTKSWGSPRSSTLLPHRRSNSDRGFHHRRVSSGLQSTTSSIGSYVTDLSKSALVRGWDASGAIQWQLPQDHVHLWMLPDCGHLYQLVDDNDKHHYHGEPDDDILCEHCHQPTHPPRLPPARYALTVSPSIYQNLLLELHQSQSMPCGLFFCGHHEDVSQPSIQIAVVLVVVLLLGMGAVASTLQG